MSEPHFAVAATFSPRFDAVIAEADRVARHFGARLSVLHAAARSDEKVGVFRDAFAKLGRDEVDIYWCEGENPAEALLDAAGSEYFDLLIAGALEKPNDLRNFTGGVARELLRRAPCDLLLLPNPTEEAAPVDRVCLMVEAWHPRWRDARRAVEALHPGSVMVLAADSPFAHAREAALGHENDGSEMDELCAELEKVAGDVDLRTVESNTGFTLCEIVQGDQPDFLIVEAEWRNRSRHLPPHLGWLDQVIPARLLLLGKPPRDE